MELGSKSVDFGVNSNRHGANGRAMAQVLEVRNQVVGDQGEQFRTDRRGFGTTTLQKRAETTGICRRDSTGFQDPEMTRTGPGSKVSPKMAGIHTSPPG
jgi:hypothetical protein